MSHLIGQLPRRQMARQRNYLCREGRIINVVLLELDRVLGPSVPLPGRFPSLPRCSIQRTRRSGRPRPPRSSSQAGSTVHGGKLELRPRAMLPRDLAVGTNAANPSINRAVGRPRRDLHDLPAMEVDPVDRLGPADETSGPIRRGISTRTIGLAQATETNRTAAPAVSNCDSCRRRTPSAARAD